MLYVNCIFTISHFWVSYNPILFFMLILMAFFSGFDFEVKKPDVVSP